MTVKYPYGYQTQMVTMERLRELTEPNLLPEMARRFYPWIESEEGRMGVGDGDRPCPDPVSPASQKCQSFHQLQRFDTGIIAYSAFDLVHINPGRVHRAPTWTEVASAEPYGLHAFIGKDTVSLKDDESWHLQCIEMRGFVTWVNKGRPTPPHYPIPTDPPDPGGLIFMERLALAGPEGNGYRLRDTRDNGGPKVAAQQNVVVTDPLAAQAKAIVINVTVTQPEANGYLAVWGFGPNPGTSKLNFAKDQTVPNEITVKLSGFHTFEVFPSCPLHYIVDVVGYWFE